LVTYAVSQFGVIAIPSGCSPAPRLISAPGVFVASVIGVS